MFKYIPAGLIFWALIALPAQAQFVTPASYTATVGEGTAQGGTFNDFDNTGTQLTDNVTGVNNWMANLENGEAFEWVGWKVAEPSLSFNFASLVNISQVQIGFNRSDIAGIFLPTTVNIGSNNFSLNNTEVNDGEREFLTFGVNFSRTNLNINLSDGDPGRWIFIDEIRFVEASSTTVPEPSLVGACGVLFIFGLSRRFPFLGLR